VKSFFILAALLFVTSLSYGQQGTQVVGIDVRAIDVLAIGGSVSLTIDSATPGQDPEPAFGSGIYSYMTNGINRKISARMDEALPEGLSLFVTMEAPQGATSAGRTALGLQDVDLVTGISRRASGGLEIAYEAVATARAEPGNMTRVITYTMTAN